MIVDAVEKLPVHGIIGRLGSAHCPHLAHIAGGTLLALANNSSVGAQTKGVNI